MSEADIVVPRHPHKMVCPGCGMARYLPDGWQEMLRSETLSCVPCHLVMVEVDQ